MTNILTPTKREPTEQEKLDNKVNAIKALNSQTYNMLKENHNKIFDLVWKSEQSPQVILDEFGTGAKQLFVISNLIQNVLQKANPVYIPLQPPTQITVNEDGTVTVHDS